MNDSAFILFNPIDPPGMSRLSRAISLVAHAALAVALIAIPYSVQQTPTIQKHFAAVTLFEPRQMPPPVVRRTFPAKRTVTKVTPVAVVVAKSTFTPPPIVKPQAVPLRETAAPALPVVARAPEPKIELPALPLRSAVVINTFDTSRPLAARTGGAASGVKLGGFDVSAADRNGDNGHTGHTVVVASSGFDSNRAPGGAPAGWGNRATGVAGFDASREVAAPTRPVAQRAANLTPQVTPVEISFKPKPAYTPDARKRKIEGEVQLEVVFRANGQISVLRVVHSLDSGLDESARAAANQIRFQPATRDGIPIDVRGIVHIVFELS
jgi:TonB family protein